MLRLIPLSKKPSHSKILKPEITDVQVRRDNCCQTLIDAIKQENCSLVAKIALQSHRWLESTLVINALFAFLLSNHEDIKKTSILLHARWGTQLFPVKHFVDSQNHIIPSFYAPVYRMAEKHYMYSIELYYQSTEIQYIRPSLYAKCEQLALMEDSESDDEICQSEMMVKSNNMPNLKSILKLRM